MPDNELGYMARSIERYRLKWQRDGHAPWWIAKQRRVALIGGEKRRAVTADRDAAIVEAVTVDGQSLRAVAREHGLTHQAVHHIVRREAPLFAPVETQQAGRPWEAEGTSRATWHRRRETGVK